MFNPCRHIKKPSQLAERARFKQGELADGRVIHHMFCKKCGKEVAYKIVNTY